MGQEVLGTLAPSNLRGVTTGAGLLTNLSATGLAVLARTDPALASKIADLDPVQARDWWAGLTESERGALIDAMPAIVGNLEGLPYGDRDTANRIWLDQQYEEASEHLKERGTRASAADRERVDALEAILATLNPDQVSSERFLISLTSDRPPLAAVSIGNLDAADNATWAVPGMGSSAESLSDWARASENLLLAQEIADPNRTHAVVAWVGYEAPPVGPFEVLSSDKAEAGAANLNRALVGFNAARPGIDLNVVAHSYGTTTASIALAQTTAHVDSYAMIGSAGLPPEIDEASDLQAEHVYAGQARNAILGDPAGGDKWAWLGRDFGDHPVDPSKDGFGADVFGVDSGSGGAPTTDHEATPEVGNGYLDQATESVRNLAWATTGQGDQMTEPITHGPTVYEQMLRAAIMNG